MLKAITSSDVQRSKTEPLGHIDIGRTINDARLAWISVTVGILAERLLRPKKEALSPFMLQYIRRDILDTIDLQCHMMCIEMTEALHGYIELCIDEALLLLTVPFEVTID